MRSVIVLGLWGVLLSAALTAAEAEALTQTASPDSEVLAETSDMAKHEAEAEAVIVRGRGLNLLGKAEAASEGRVGAEDLAKRPVNRPGELVEAVPGLVVSQHSGDGKANQFYARGFNLDHGTDFATWVEGMPVNLRTHGHGQGYSDLNFLIPELVELIEYRKGPYGVHDGDFSAVGAAEFSYAKDLKLGLVQLTHGAFGYARALFALSPQIGPGTLLFAVDAARNDGPWDQKQDLQRHNFLAKYSLRLGGTELSLTALAFNSSWTATNQVAQRAVNSGLIGRYGTLDSSDGGDTFRNALTAQWRTALGPVDNHGSAYAFTYGLHLISNPTFFQADTVNGDQIEQVDQRTVFGGTTEFAYDAGVLGSETELGVEGRYDNIYGLELWQTSRRQRLAAVGRHVVGEASAAVYLHQQLKPLDKLRLQGGARYDSYSFKVDAYTDTTVAVLNSGEAQAGIFSPKAGLALGPWAGTELYLSWGQAFHSNDARGITQKWADEDGDGILDEVGTATPLVKIQGSELGLRTSALPGLNSTLALWQLDFDSELIFVGDAQATEAGRPSKRWGLEWANHYKPLRWLVLDADYSWSYARYSQDDPAGNHVPGALEDVVTGGVTLEQGPWTVALRARYFGARPLTEDNSVRSSSSMIWNLRVAARPWDGAEFSAEVFNLFDVQASDVEYWYPSLLSGETPVDDSDDDAIPDAVNDIHMHAAEPRQLRVVLLQRF
jgi:hypothetical protein